MRAAQAIQTEPTPIPLDSEALLQGNQSIPPGASGGVICARDSGGSRHSPRNRSIAGEMQQAGWVTSMDWLVLDQQAFRLSSVKKLVMVPEATHLFEEPGKLEEVARLACDWFTYHLGATTRGEGHA